MPVNVAVADKTQARYAWLRDNGHRLYVEKATKCEDFFAGLQWASEDMALLRSQKRPALTINKIISTMSNVMGEQIFNRTDIAFKPRNNGANSEVADALTKVFMQISDNNQLNWVRSDVFCDGVIGSRGFFDVRLDFSDSLRGEVRVVALNPKDVLIDCDADSYDPDKWNDVITTKWLSANDIELTYSKSDADILRVRSSGSAQYGHDSIEYNRDRFGSLNGAYDYATGPGEYDRNARNIRVIDHQYYKLDNLKHFVDVTTGDMRQIPSGWDEARIQQYLAQNPMLSVTKKMVRRIRWTVVADNVVLHDDWSPYKHFTVVPYFPHFRRGRTLGLVENLLGPQELLNKVSSQELHVVNTTANSGWIVKKNALKNMSIAELEQRGAQTGLVLELDDIDGAQKIIPNQVPTGLDRISFKAEEHIKGISGVSDYMQGTPREDVSAKAVNSNKQSGQANLAKVMDNMNRTDHILARNILDAVQEYYTEERLLHITTDRMTNATEQMTVNQMTAEGQIVNNLTLGEYAVVVTNQPERDTFEETQFDQALRLRMDAGVAIPDKFIIQSSHLRNKAEIVKAMEGDQESPEAQAEAARQARLREAEVATAEAEAAQKRADAELKVAKSQKELASIGEDSGQNEIALEQQKLNAELEMEERKLQQEFEFKYKELEMEMELKRQEMQMNLQIKQEESRANAMTNRIAAVEQAKNQPTPTKTKKV